MTNPNTAPVEQVDDLIHSSMPKDFERRYEVEQVDYNLPPHEDEAFVKAWCEMEDAGYQYSESNVAKVHLGWLMARHRLATTAPLQARVEELERALKPFARSAEWWAAFHDFQRITALHQHGDCLEVHHLREAQAALSTTPATSRLAELEAENARLSAALRRIATGTYDGLEVDHYNASHCRRIARAALNPEGES